MISLFAGWHPFDTSRFGSARLGSVFSGSPSSALLPVFGSEGSSTKIDHSKKNKQNTTITTTGTRIVIRKGRGFEPSCHFSTGGRFWFASTEEMRFLISADLVNLVSESFAARSARFAKAKKRAWGSPLGAGFSWGACRVGRLTQDRAKYGCGCHNPWDPILG